MNRTEKQMMERAQDLARERGYDGAEVVEGALILKESRKSDGNRVYWVDWIEVVLAPRLLVDWGHKCESWAEAVRLLGLVPPVRRGQVS